jgi:hypothetical protein
MSHSFLFHRKNQQLVFYISVRLKIVFCGHWTTHNIDDHGSHPGNTLQTLTGQGRPEASGEALNMPHWARCTTSPGTATMVIKTDQYNQ